VPGTILEPPFLVYGAELGENPLDDLETWRRFWGLELL